MEQIVSRSGADAVHGQLDCAGCDCHRDEVARNMWHGHEAGPPLHLHELCGPDTRSSMTFLQPI